MSTPAVAHRPRWRLVFLAILVAVSLYYLNRAVHYRFVVPGRLGPANPIHPLWYWTHLAFALPVLLGARLQFVAELRQRAPRVHRTIGKAYVAGACVAACTAIYMGGAGPYEGSRLLIVVTGMLWLFFTLAAWRLAVRRSFAAHRAFMIRSYTLALVLVWLR